MIRSIQARLLASSFGVIIAGVTLSNSYFSRSIERERVAEIRDDLQRRLALVEAALGGVALRDREGAPLDALADDLGRRAGARVTLIDAAGRVMGDSEVDGAELARLGPHGDRPEVRDALAFGTGASDRASETLSRRMMYAARAVRGPGGEVGVARIAVPLDDVDRALRSLRIRLVAATMLASVIAVLLSAAATQMSTRPLDRLMSVARRMALGDLTARVDGDDLHGEFRDLARTLDRMAVSLSSTLGELESERDLLEGILLGMQEGVLLVDERGSVVLMNPALRSMFLVGRDTTGKPLSEVVCHPTLEGLFDKARRDSAPAKGEIEFGGLKPRTLLVHAVAQHAPPGGLMAVFVDVTDMRRLESLRRDFVANASHELRTPVSSILSAAETLRDGAQHDPGASRRFVDIIVRNADRLGRLVDDLLELSRVESRDFTLTIEDHDAATIFAHVLGLFRERADKKRQRLETDVALDEGSIRVDRRALETVLTNLIDNAVKYCPEGASISLVARRGEAGLVLEVRDTGPGIDRRHLPRIFERFYRVDAGRSRDVGGTGLGLSIVKHLVEAMRGAIDVQSEVGKGTTFRLRLPAS